MSMQSTRTGLVELAIGGDKSAFGALVEQDWDSLVGLARSIIGQLQCEDIVQEALLVAWKKLPQLDQPAAFSGWLRKIVIRKCLGHTRRRIWAAPLAVLGNRAGPTRDPSGRIDVERLLQLLAPRQRVVLYLTVIEGMTDSEIGKLLWIRPASGRSHRRRARQVLVKKLRAPNKSEEVIGELG